MSVQPEIGMGATVRTGSDCSPYTVIAVTPSGKRVTIQEDKATATKDNSYTESQEYSYETNTEGRTYDVSLRKNGCWHKVGDTMEWWNVVTIGTRRMYRDPSF